MIRKTIRVILGFFVSLYPIAGLGIFVVVLFATSESVFPKYILPALIFLSSLYLAKQIFSAIMSRGFIEFFSYVDKTPEADNLYDEDCVLTPELYVEKFNFGRHLFRAGCIEIWGDKRGRDLDVKNHVAMIEYSNKTLCIQFKNRNELIIFGADKIVDEATYFKIINAKKIIWNWGNSKYQFTYENTGSEIITKSNFKWRSRSLDVLMQHPAVFIYHV